MREIIPRTSVGTEATMALTSSASEATGIKNAPTKEETKPGTQSGTAIAVLAIGIGGALYFMSREKAGFQVSSMPQPAQARLWLDRVERQAHRTSTELKDLTPAQRGAIEDVRMCAESAYGKFK